VAASVHPGLERKMGLAQERDLAEAVQGAGRDVYARPKHADGADQEASQVVGARCSPSTGRQDARNRPYVLFRRGYTVTTCPR
jgi:hypothetical protein